jgi:hypothetical protein
MLPRSPIERLYEAEENLRNAKGDGPFIFKAVDLTLLVVGRNGSLTTKIVSDLAQVLTKAAVVVTNLYLRPYIAECNDLRFEANAYLAHIQEKENP